MMGVHQQDLEVVTVRPLPGLLVAPDDLAKAFSRPPSDALSNEVPAAAFSPECRLLCGGGRGGELSPS